LPLFFRTLYRKRKELIYLKEETTRLQVQLKSKRRNLFTLEKILETTQNQPIPTETVVDNPSAKIYKPNSHALIKFFVAFSDGMYIELEESSEITIKYLLSILNNLLYHEQMNKTKSFMKKKYNDRNPEDDDDGVERIDGKNRDILIMTPNYHINLYLRGKLLLASSSLAEIGLQTGDTILATVISEDVPYTSTAKPKKQPVVEEKKVDNGENGLVTKELIMALSQQTDCIHRLAKEIK
jgi:hypothetical protein